MRSRTQPQQAAIEPSAAPAAAELLKDPQGAELLQMGMTKFLDLQKRDPTFPRPVWLGERGKRHVRSELLAWALSRRERTAA